MDKLKSNNCRKRKPVSDCFIKFHQNTDFVTTSLQFKLRTNNSMLFLKNNRKIS